MCFKYIIECSCDGFFSSSFAMASPFHGNSESNHVGDDGVICNMMYDSVQCPLGRRSQLAHLLKKEIFVVVVVVVVNKMN